MAVSELTGDSGEVVAVGLGDVVGETVTVGEAVTVGNVVGETVTVGAGDVVGDAVELVFTEVLVVEVALFKTVFVVVVSVEGSDGNEGCSGGG